MSQKNPLHPITLPPKTGEKVTRATHCPPVPTKKPIRPVSRSIEDSGYELLCFRHSHRVDFCELKYPDAHPGCIRLYGNTLQLRGYGPITDNGKGKPRQMIATASFLDKAEVTALIAKLQEILPTL